MKRLHVEQWFFPFIDVLFVAAVKNISSVTGECDDSSLLVYVTTASFLMIMFSSRVVFDVFSHSYGTRASFTPLFVFPYTLGVFCMTFFIAVIPDYNYLPLPDDVPTFYFGPSDKLFHFGGCYQGLIYSFGFAAGFLLTRATVILGYWNQYKVETGVITPSIDVINEALRSREAPNNLFLSAVKEFHAFQALKGVQEKVVFYRGLALGYQLGANHVTVDKSHLKILDNFAFENIFEIAVFSTSAIVVGLGYITGFPQPYWMLAAALIEALGTSFKREIFEIGQSIASVVTLKPTMASLEAAEPVKKSKSDQGFVTAINELYKRTAHFYQGRLGLFFMLILGEAILGLAVIDLRTGELSAVEHGLIDVFFSFMIIIGVGYLYSVSTDVVKGEHALATSSFVRRNLYIWFHFVIGFAMLMVSNSMEHLVKETQLHGGEYSDTTLLTTRMKLGFGLSITTLCLHLLRYLHLESTKAFDVKSCIAVIVVIAHAVVCVNKLSPPVDFLLTYHCIIVVVEVAALVTVNTCINTNDASFQRKAAEIMMTAVEPYRNSLEIEDNRLSLPPEDQLVQAEEVFGISRQESSQTLITHWLQKNVDLEQAMLTSKAHEIQRNSDIRRGQWSSSAAYDRKSTIDSNREIDAASKIPGSRRASDDRSSFIFGLPGVGGDSELESDSQSTVSGDLDGIVTA